MKSFFPKSIGFLLFILAISCIPLFAQGYSILVQCPPSITGRLQCTTYPNTSTPQKQRPYIENQEATFIGTLQEPCLMQISHPALPQPLFFFAENANIVIKLDPLSPNKSPITGSRINSRYRYALESHNPEYESNWLTNLINENLSEIYAPFILYQQAHNIPFTQLEQLFKQLSGPALHTYHYQKLKTQLHQLQATIEGATLPDFVFNNTKHQAIHLDSIHSSKKPSILLFSASWCKQGQAIANQLQTDYPQLQTIVIPIDAHPKQWDAPYLEQLSIDRIPFMILIDQNKKILTRDVRIWELSRLIAQFQLFPNEPSQP